VRFSHQRKFTVAKAANILLMKLTPDFLQMATPTPPTADLELWLP